MPPNLIIFITPLYLLGILVTLAALRLYFAIEKCREMQLKMQRFATHLIPFRQCVGQSIALAMKRDDMGVMN